jgi:hypothetical protein
MNHTTTRRLGLAAGVAATLTLGLAAAGPAGAHRGSAFVANGTLFVEAGSGSQSVALRLAAGNTNTLEVDFDDDGVAERSFDRTTFTAIRVNLGSGSDQFRVDQVNGTFADETLSVRGGSGNDTMNGGDAAELFEGGSGNDAVDGNRGDDTGILGSGSDSFRWDPGDGSDVVEGQSGRDTLDFNGAGANENMQLVPNGERSLFLRDVANIRMDMDGVERLDLTALGGTDTVLVDDMTDTDFRKADIDLQGPAGGPDGQPDVVTVNGTDDDDYIDVDADDGVVTVEGLQTRTNITGAELIDRLQVNALGGDDDVDVDPDATAVMGVSVDLGSGES